MRRRFRKAYPSERLPPAVEAAAYYLVAGAAAGGGAGAGVGCGSSAVATVGIKTQAASATIAASRKRCLMSILLSRPQVAVIGPDAP